jgi:hypothetical protein
MVRLKVLSAVAFGALMTAGGAFAAEAVKPAAYSGNAGNAQEQVKGVEGATNTIGSLPFTGLDLALIVGAGLVLLIAGLALRRISARRTAA